MVKENSHPATMPNHCGNCRWRLWDENGIQCRNHHRLDDRQVEEMHSHLLEELKQEWPELFELDWSDPDACFDCGGIEYSDVCAMWEGQRDTLDRVRDWDREPVLTDAEVKSFDVRVREIGARNAIK